MFTRAGFALALFAVAAPPASAQAVNDVKCVLVSNLYSKAAKEPKQQALAEASKFFYLGRIHGRVNPAQLKAQAPVQAKSLSPATAGPAMDACVKEMEASVRSIQEAMKQP